MRIRLHFVEWDSFPVDLVIDVLTRTERATFKDEMEDLEAAFYEFADIPPVARDAALYRMNQFKGRSLLVEGSDRGSLTVTIVLTGLGLWVLQNTVGETFKDAWKESGMHERLKEFFLYRFKEKPDRVARKIEMELGKKGIDAKTEAHVEGKDIEITVFQTDREQTPPKISDIEEQK